MKTCTIIISLSEAKLKASLNRAKTEKAKANVRKLYPALPIAFTPTNRNGDKSEVDNWTREIKGSKKEIKRNKGFIYFEIKLTLPNYTYQNYETEFVKFVREYLKEKNSHMGFNFISTKIEGTISSIEAVKDSVKEVKANYVDNSLEQLKEQKDDYAKFLKDNKKIIIGGTAAIGVILLIVALK